MSGTFKLMLTLVPVAAGLFAVYHLLILRYATGDTYPHYSTFRADPMGMRAYYQALDRVPGVTASRNLDPLHQIGEGTDTTLIIAGAQISDDPDFVLEAIEQFVQGGGRLVIAFHGDSFLADADEPQDDGTENDDETEDEEPEPIPHSDISERWGFEYGQDSEEQGWEAVLEIEQPAGNLPRTMPWRSGLFFENPEDPWQVVYHRGGKPVILQRFWDNGSIVLMSDSYLLSNEALRNARQSGFLAWLTEPNHSVVFDEVHLGVGHNPGAIGLARRYGLETFGATLAVLVALFIWYSMSSLIPKREVVTPGRRAVRGRGTSEALTSLVARSVPAGDLAGRCVEEWDKLRSRTDEADDALVRQIQSVIEEERAVPLHRRAPARAYRRIQEIITEKRGTF